MRQMTRTLLIFLSAIWVFTGFTQDYQWAKSIGGNSNDICQDMAVDNQGNVYISGIFRGTNVDFDPGSGTAYLSSAGGDDIFFAKYDSLGNYLWAHSVGGANDDIGARIAVDDDGNVYVTGWFASVNVDFDPGSGTKILSSAGGTDGYLASYTTDGSYRWAFNLGSTLNEGSHDVCLDDYGHVFISGYFQGTNVDFDPGPGTAFLSSQGNSGDIFIAKYTTGGAFVWAKQASGSNYEVGNGIITDQAGNVFITGCFIGSVDFDPGPGSAMLTSAGGYDIFLAKYDSASNYLWANRFGGAGDDIGSDVAVDASGNVVISSNFHGTGIDFDPGSGSALLSSNGGYDMAIAKYGPDGGYLWAFQSGGNQDDYTVKVITDAQGKVYHTGAFRGTKVDFDPGPGKRLLTSSGIEDIFFAVYNPDGKFLRARRIGGAYSDWGNTIALTSGGNIRIAGCFAGSNIDFDPGQGTAYLSSKGAVDIFFAGFSAITQGSAYFGQSDPGVVPVPFAPSFIIPDQSPYGYFGITFSPDGNECFFGMYPDIMTSKLTGGIWPDPVTAFFSGTDGDMEACISPENSRLFFSSDRPLSGAPYNISRLWYCDRTSSGWTNSEAIEQPLRDMVLMFPSLNQSGDLYLSMTDNTNQWISVSRLVNGHYQAPQMLSDSVNFNDRTGHSYIAPDESYIVFDALDHMSGSNPCRDLYISHKKQDGNWSTARYMGDTINTYNGNEVCPFVSRDSKYLFFTRNGNIYWVNAPGSIPVGIVEIPSGQQGIEDLRIFPNPAFQRTTVKFRLPVRKHVHVLILDILGRPLGTFIDQDMQEGEHVQEISLDGLDPGMYFVSLSAGENRISGRLFIRN